MASYTNGFWMKRLACATILGALVAGGCSRNAAPTYQTAPVARGGVTNVVTATGALNPVLNVTVGCQVSGRISKLYVDFNSPVTNGQLIAEIDPRTYQASVAQAQADLANASANQELQIAEANRALDLFTNKLISLSDRDTSIATLHEADAIVQIKQASLSNAMANLGYCKIYSPVDGTVISRAVDVGQTVAASLSAPTLFQIANDLTKMQIDSAVAEADVGGVVEGQRVDFAVDAYPYRTFHGGVTQVRNAPTTVNNVVTYDCVIGVTNADYKLKPGMTANVSIVVAEMDDVLKIPNGALRFRPPDPSAVQTSTNATANIQNVSATNSGARIGGAGGGPGGRRFGQGGGFGRGGGRGDRQMRTVYVLADSKGDSPQLRPVQIRVGISDGINTQVLDGLNEGDMVVTGMTGGAQNTAPAGNPFGGGGGFPRRF
jgi:HlyD family secretion protein